jgi:hypothetical protein
MQRKTTLNAWQRQPAANFSGGVLIIHVRPLQIPVAAYLHLQWLIQSNTIYLHIFQSDRRKLGVWLE